ncbi:MAG: hypothetical protein ACYS1A_20420 [Planctomycetota bacterium]|jgi:hypothetical protein
MNHGYKMYQRALDNTDRWFVEVLTVDDTSAITKEAIKNEIRDGMSEDTGLKAPIMSNRLPAHAPRAA